MRAITEDKNRVRVIHVDSRIGRFDAEAQVVLSLGSRPALGESGASHNEDLALAQATVDAIRRLSAGRLPLDLDWAATVEFPGTLGLYSVRIRALNEKGHEVVLFGVGQRKMEPRTPAPVRAVLHAMNRWVVFNSDRPKPTKTHFISYSHKDGLLMGRVAQLIDSEGMGTWIDEDVPAGRVWEDETPDAIKKASSVVVLWTKESAQSDYVKQEAKQAADLNKLISVEIDPDTVPASLRPIQAIEAHGWDGRTNEHWEKLRDTLAGGSSAKS